MRCLVTGAAGFIGSHLDERLVSDGHEVIGLDDFSTGHPRDIAHLADEPQFTMHEADISDPERIRPLFEGVDWVFHLAARADIVPSIVNPMVYHRTNVDGTMAVLEASRTASVKRFLYIASSTCYGLPDTFPTPETAPPRPMYPYALTKYVAEQYVLHWHRTYGLPAISIRLFNVFGTRHRTTGTYGAVFGVFLAQKLAGKPYTVIGDGTQTRDFTYVSDVVEACIAAISSDISGEVFNVGSGNTYSINRLVKLLGGEAVNIPKRPGEPDSTFADISKIATALDWKPKVSLEEGVAIMLDNIDYWCDAPVWTPDAIKGATADWFKYLGDD